jgi:hypothetical protein
MKEDYLWDKTGEDSEIEALESTLSVFRFKPDAPPVLPVTASENSEGRLWRWRFLLVPAFAAVVIGAIAIGLLSRGTSREDVAQLTDASNAQQPIADPIPDGPSVTGSLRETAPVIIPRDPSLPEPAARVSMVKPRRSVHPSRKRSESALTAEEKYAYDRLMLALSITGSKLRMVQDKVNGTGVEKTETNNNK